MATMGLTFAIIGAFIGSFAGAFFHKLGFKLFTKNVKIPSFWELYLIQLLGCAATLLVYSLFSNLTLDYLITAILGYVVSSLTAILVMLWMTKRYTDADAKAILKSLGIIIGVYVIFGVFVVSSSLVISDATSQLNQIDLGY